MFPIRDPKVPISSSSNNNKKKDTKKPITDTYYNKVSYRESRNIFSSNEPVDPENRLYTDTATHMHQFWTDTIIGSKTNNISAVSEIPVEGEKLFNSEITQNFLKELSKLNKNTNHTPIGCKKCGYVGHFSYECRNYSKSKKTDKSNKSDKDRKEDIVKQSYKEKRSSENEEEMLKKKKKKEKKDKKEKNNKKRSEKNDKSGSSSESSQRKNNSERNENVRRIMSSSTDKKQKNKESKNKRDRSSSS